MSSIPEEIYHDILVRLPAKSILVCKCVCKNWFKLLSHTDFVKSHLHVALTAASGNNNPSICISSGKKIYTTKYDSLLSSTSLKEFNDNNAVEMYCPFDSLNYVELLGSCNGVVLLSFRDGAIFCNKGFLCLWNPFTREYKQIPVSPNDCEIGEIGIYAFGYDSKIDTYKVFETVHLREAESVIVNVYTLESNSWKTIQPIPYDFSDKAGVLVNGSLHWSGRTRTGDICKYTKTISLDVSNERFEEINIPKEILEESRQGYFLGVLEGCLCLLSYVQNTCFDARYEVWMMRDYGVKESWTRFQAITLKSIKCSTYVSKMWSFKSDEILLQKAGGKLFLYHPRHSSGRDLKIVYLIVANVENLVESLVSLNSGTFTGIKNNGRNGTNMKRSKKIDGKNDANLKRQKKNN